MIDLRYQPHSHVILLLQVIVLVGLLLQVLPLATSLAQVTTAITSDGSLGSQVMPNGDIHDIMGGTRPGAGPNLFHSFEQFSIGAGDTANFLNETGAATNNILSRVTGGNPSNIFGTIKTTGFPGTNLFLMNPAGIVFGPTASLNVSGAVHFTTADYLKLADNIQFIAVPGPSDLVLSVPPVAAFGFLNENPTGITYNGTFDDGSSLNVLEGQTLSLVGGNIWIAGDGSFDTAILGAPSGQVNLVSVASSGEAIFDSSQSASDLNVDTFEQLGEILLTEGALIDLLGYSDKGGTGVIRSGRLELVDSAVFADTGDLDGAPIGIDVSVRGDILVDDSFLTADSFGQGNAGGIRINADNLHLRGTPNDDPDNPSTKIGSLGFGSGETGNVEVMIKNNLQMEGRAEITSSAFNGNAGDIVVSAMNVSISGTSNQAANGGIGANTFGSGDGGSIQLTATNLTLTNVANIQSSTLENTSEDAGTVTIDLAGNLVIENGSVILGKSDGTGRAADLDITAKDISIAGIRDATDPTDRLNGMFTGIDSSAGRGGGQGGNVNIMSENLLVTDKAIIKTSTEGAGEGGQINIEVLDQLSLLEGASITAESTSEGNAGNINLKADDTILVDKSTVTTEATEASGGNIKLQAEELIRLNDSTISSSVQGNATTVGGNISLDPEFIILQNSRILANAVEGQGGNISLVATNAVLVDPFSRLDASSALGVNGSVDIQAPIQNLSGTLAPLPEDTVPVSTLYGARCAAGQGGHFSTFVNSKADSLSPTPGTFLASPLLVFPSQAPAIANASNNGAPVVLTASLFPLLLGETGQSLTACP